MKFTIPAILTILVLFLVSCSKDRDESSLDGKVIRSIYIDPDGTKWFATEKGISSFKGDTWTNFSEESGLPSAAMNDLAQTPSPESELWIASDMGAFLGQLESDILTIQSEFTAGNSNLPDDTVLSVAPDSSGYIWIGTQKGLAGLKNHTSWYIPDDEAFALPISGIGSAAGGWNYFATIGGGVARNKTSVDGVSSASAYFIPWAGLPSDSVYAVYVEPSTGYQWFGTNRGAAYHAATETKRNWTTYTTSEGLVDDFVLFITGDASGSIWFGTKGGVSRLQNSTWTSYTEADGLANNTVYAIAIDKDGSLWFGTADGVSHFISGTWTTYR